MDMTHWTPAHQNAARAEGWDIFDNGEHYHAGQFTISRFDVPKDFDLESKPLKDDQDAWGIVHRGFVQNSALHLHAMAIISVVNIEHYYEILAA